MSSFFDELKRRNVYRVAVVYCDLLRGLLTRPSEVTVPVLKLDVGFDAIPQTRASRRYWRSMVRKRSAILVALVVAATVARADWQLVSSSAVGQKVEGVEHRRVVYEETQSGERATLDLALFSTASATVRVIDNRNGSDTLAAAAAREHCLAGVNGGYFDPDNAPVGLVVIDSKTISPFRKARLLSGLVATDAKRLRLLRSSEFSAATKYSSALQCGPFLVDRGKPVAGLEPSRAARRTFVATAPGNRAAIGYSTPVSLAQLGRVLSLGGVFPETKIERALNLDGGSSSAFWFGDDGTPFSTSEQKTVRNFLVLVPR